MKRKRQEWAEARRRFGETVYRASLALQHGQPQVLTAVYLPSGAEVATDTIVVEAMPDGTLRVSLWRKNKLGEYEKTVLKPAEPVLRALHEDPEPIED